MTLATRIGVMDAGKIRQVGEPRQVYEHPDNRFVADFIGTVNLFEGKVDAAAPDRMRIQTPEGPILAVPMAGLTAGQSVAVAVRPEKMTLSRRPVEAENVIRAKVEDYAYMGDVTIFKLGLPTGKSIKVTAANSESPDQPLTWEEEVFVGWSAPSSVVLTA